MSLKIDLAIKKAKEKVNRSIEDSIDKKDMDELASFAANMITKRTRLGYGVSDNGQEKSKLEKLKGRPSPYKSTIRARIYAEKRGELSRETTPVKSNLTMTGQLLDSIIWTVEKTKAILFIPNTNRRNSDLTNREVGGYVSKKRPFVS